MQPTSRSEPVSSHCRQHVQRPAGDPLTRAQAHRSLNGLGNLRGYATASRHVSRKKLVINMRGQGLGTHSLTKKPEGLVLVCFLVCRSMLAAKVDALDESSADESFGCVPMARFCNAISWSAHISKRQWYYAIGNVVLHPSSWINFEFPGLQVI